ncbi:MAG: diguanylate cyclase response regulator [Deltaproteobacteria bacterium RIFOXYD12_FULL_57_12]|nr:MAG: diguanylate cyclase response regulator [Deltaproteobacteria bacterium RIFOXYD12_FULL_57_12]
MPDNQKNEGISPLHAYRITVLLIDDQAIIAEAVRRALSSEKDIDFHYCQNPTEAIQMATQIKPTVILQDLVMPEIDGLMMVRFFRVKPETAQVPIIVLSTKEEPEIKSEAFSLGANDYLVKLPAKVELIARIRYHSRSYINLKERDEAFQALQESQKRLAEANRTLQRLSSLDGLTGIANRRSFDETLHKEWQRAMRQGTPLSLIMLDIDFFKLYNDHYGHQGGDDCLKSVAAALEGSLQRETDFLARYGGEEFSAVLPETDQAGALKIAEGMRAAVQEKKLAHAKSKVSDHVSISVGVGTCIPKRDGKPEALISSADQALYKAKEEGRNRVKGSDPAA